MMKSIAALFLGLALSISTVSFGDHHEGKDHKCEGESCDHKGGDHDHGDKDHKHDH